MKFVKLILLFIVASTYVAKSQSVDSLLDERDGQVYCIKKFGDKTWMTENLNFVIEKSYCYQNNEENCEIYGRLYYLDAALEACPAGWHLASDADWQEMEKYLGMSEQDLNKSNAWRGTDQGALLLSDSTIGFNILLGGYRNPPANNNLKGMQAFFWTSTVEGGFAYMRQFYINSPKIYRRTRPKSWAFSVRCVKD